MKEIVYLIGPPCAGKSTIINAWQASGGIIVPEFTDPVPDYVHNAWLGDEATRAKAQAWAFEQNLRKNKILTNLVSEQRILVERSVLDVLAYSRVFGGRVATWTETMIARNQWQPGKLILLTTKLETLQQRWLQERGLSPTDWQNQWQPLTAALMREYTRLQETYGIPRLSTEDNLSVTLAELNETLNHAPRFTLEGMIFRPGGKERR